MSITPTFRIERMVIEKGYTAIVGVDEAGAGALAGPLVAGAVMLPLDSRLGEIRDSKVMTERQKVQAFNRIKLHAHAWGVGVASVEEIFTLGLRPSNYLAMRRAVEAIPSAEFALVDAWTIPELSIPQQGIIRGDATVKSIAAASIIAKVTRDRMMKKLAQEFPVYQFEKHKGYGTKLHRDLIKEFGPCKIHRMKYKTFRT